ncbi:uncharacterized protein MAM_02748 [Metarhizium album ARSEF 1941]|uniref:Uncharacterized protein n=1 Tax=Metarhizium album (strain ARSEF 1941) TaxID=1081103 RepID=A0A0B2X1Q8_METAS|nr:uncharacterized protein MAM_02748 [Metarhizium album ARSEF 1941]KHN99050.1 hypothetical protein MAM_02748 [Metarhizium album ARSEF 1941]
MVSAWSTESFSSRNANEEVYPAGRMKTMDYMYSIWPIPRNPSLIMRFLFYIMGAPMAATHVVAKFPRSRFRESRYVYDPQDLIYTEKGAYVYWATAQGTYDLFRYWGFSDSDYVEEGAAVEMADVVEEAAGGRCPGEEPPSSGKEA